MSQEDVVVIFPLLYGEEKVAILANEQAAHPTNQKREISPTGHTCNAPCSRSFFLNSFLTTWLMYGIKRQLRHALSAENSALSFQQNGGRCCFSLIGCSKQPFDWLKWQLSFLHVTAENSPQQSPIIKKLKSVPKVFLLSKQLL